MNKKRIVPKIRVVCIKVGEKRKNAFLKTKKKQKSKNPQGAAKIKAAALAALLTPAPVSGAPDRNSGRLGGQWDRWEGAPHPQLLPSSKGRISLSGCRGVTGCGRNPREIREKCSLLLWRRGLDSREERNWDSPLEEFQAFCANPQENTASS